MNYILSRNMEASRTLWSPGIPGTPRILGIPGTLTISGILGIPRTQGIPGTLTISRISGTQFKRNPKISGTLTISVIPGIPKNPEFQKY